MVNAVVAGGVGNETVSRILISIAIVLAATYLMALGYMYLFSATSSTTRAGAAGAGRDRVTTSEPCRSGAEGAAIAGGGAAAAGHGHPLFPRQCAGFSREHERYEAPAPTATAISRSTIAVFRGRRGDQRGQYRRPLAAFDWLQAKGFPVLLWGRSLGSGPATYVASVREARGLLLETPFDSAVAVAADRYGFLPVQLLMHDQFRVEDWIRDVAEPVFVAHGTADRTIGVQHGQRVYDLVPNKAGLWIEEGADHGDLWERGIWDRAKAFFAALP